jgi:hypothetical protein
MPEGAQLLLLFIQRYVYAVNIIFQRENRFSPVWFYNVMFT